MAYSARDSGGLEGEAGPPVSLGFSRKRFNVREVLGSPRCAFVLDQGGATDDRDGPSLESKASTLCDGLIERDAVSSVQDVDSPRWKSDLQNSVISGEVGGTNLKGLQGRAKCRERLIDTFGIGGICSDQDVHVLRRAWVAVERNSVTTQQHELGAGVGQLYQ